MPIYIEITDAQNEKKELVFLNSVIRIFPNGDTTIITVIDKGSIVCEESYQEVKDLIRDAFNRSKRIFQKEENVTYEY